MSAQWYFVDDDSGERKGPLTREEIGVLIRSQRIGADTLVWTKGLSDWLPAGETGLRPELREAQESRQREGPPLPGAPSASAEAEMIYYRQGMMVQGPIPRRQMRTLISNGLLGPRTDIRPAGEEGWTPLAEVTEFAAELREGAQASDEEGEGTSRHHRRGHKSHSSARAEESFRVATDTDDTGGLHGMLFALFSLPIEVKLTVPIALITLVARLAFPGAALVVWSLHFFVMMLAGIIILRVRAMKEGGYGFARFLIGDIAFACANIEVAWMSLAMILYGFIGGNLFFAL